MMKDQRVSFLANCCHICKGENPKLECEICHMISYCSMEHRRQHWQAHSHLCRALYKTRSSRGLEHVYGRAVGMSAEEYRSLRHATAQECTQLLGRSLESWELEMLYHPKKCNYCNKVSPNQLSPCQDCNFTYTCQDTHFNKNHSRSCPTLKTYVEIVRFLHEEGVPAIPKVPLSVVAPSMAQCISSFTECIPENKISHAFASELLTYPLTVLHTLIILPAGPQTCVHIVGAELEAEVLPIIKWETYLLHHLPDSSNLKLVFVGPDLRDTDVLPIKNRHDVCENCRTSKKTMSYELVPGTMYHDYCKSDSVSKPDLITALNAGLYRSQGFKGVDSWGPTLDAIFKPGAAPILITEYTSCEISQDHKLLQKRYPHVQVKQGPHCNPYASLKPNLNVISDDETPVIFKNYFSMLVSN